MSAVAPLPLRGNRSRENSRMTDLCTRRSTAAVAVIGFLKI